MSLPLAQTHVLLHPTVPTVAIRREILSVLAGADTKTVPAATAEIAAVWSARQRLRGDSPSSVQTAAAIVFQVGADLVDEERARLPGRRALSCHTTREA